MLPEGKARPSLPESPRDIYLSSRYVSPKAMMLVRGMREEKREIKYRLNEINNEIDLLKFIARYGYESGIDQLKHVAGKYEL